MRDQGINGRHDVTMYDRGRASVTGVKEVVSFDSNEILLETTRGALAFCGEGLHVKRLTVEKGEVDLVLQDASVSRMHGFPFDERCWVIFRKAV